MLHYFGFTIQLALLHVFYVKVKNLAFNASQIVTNASFSMKNYPPIEILVKIETTQILEYMMATHFTAEK